MEPLTDIITLLRPKAIISKLVTGAGNWGVRYEKFGHPSFALVLEGSCWLTLKGMIPALLKKGDFVFLPTTPDFVLASDLETEPMLISAETYGDYARERRHGDQAGAPSLILQSGFFKCDPVNETILLRFLPELIHVRSSNSSVGSLEKIIGLLEDEVAGMNIGRDLILERLIEILLIETLRSASLDKNLQRSGVLAGLCDSRIAVALRLIHADIAKTWSVGELGRQAGMSRSSFADRFAKIVGISPIEYLLQLRVAIAKNLLLREKRSVSEVSFTVGYQSISAFSVAFKRATGLAPGVFARQLYVDPTTAP